MCPQKYLRSCLALLAQLEKLVLHVLPLTIVLTLNLTAVGESAHTFFKGLFLKKCKKSAKNTYSTENIC
jgi:hypothetical protein